MPQPALCLVVDSASPPYLQVADGLRREILAGSLSPGTRLPAVRPFAQELSVAPGTVKSAYKMLAEEGLLRASVLGTFVAERKEIATSRRRALDLGVETFRHGLLDKGFNVDEVRASLRRAAAKE